MKGAKTETGHVESGRLEVLYEDPALLIVAKPIKLHTAPLSEGETNTLQALVLALFPEVVEVPGIKPMEHGLLHRLDRETSGVVVIARTVRAFELLRAQFAGQEVEKEYCAICECQTGMRAGERFTIQSKFAALGPGRRAVRVLMPDPMRRKPTRKATRDVYFTEAKLERLQGERGLVRAVIRKGFRHQIRAHLAHEGLPIFGDALYGVPTPPGAPRRMYLHASSISFMHPDTGKPLRVCSILPEAFTMILESP
jgi:23S rRNA pseudouridine1911/1915/1917 synthase